MLHKDLTEKILGACFEVSTELGAGFLESDLQLLPSKFLIVEETYDLSC